MLFRSADFKTVLINTWDGLKDKLLLSMTDREAAQLFGARGSRNNLVPLPMALNFFLYYVTARSLLDEVNYKVKTKVLLKFIDYCHYNLPDRKMGYGHWGTAIKCGTDEKGRAYYFSLLIPPDNTPFSMGAAFMHTSFLKTRSELLECAPSTKQTIFRLLGPVPLEKRQKEFVERIEHERAAFLLHSESPKNSWVQEESSSLEVTFSDDSVASDDSSANSFVGPKSQRPIVPPNPTSTNNNNNFQEVSFDDEADLSDYLPPAEISTLNNTNLDESALHPNLVENLNNDNMLSSLLENEDGVSNTTSLTYADLARAENNVLNETVTDCVRRHHQKRSSEYSSEQFEASFIKALGREENRALSRKRRGISFTGKGETLDLRNEIMDIRYLKAKPPKAFLKQDDDYLDYAFYGFIREAGTVINDIMTLPQGLDYNSERRGDEVYIRAIHFRNTFTHVTGTKASGRMVLFATDKEYSHDNMFGVRTFDTIETHDILQKSVTMYAGDLEEAEAIDAFYNPTIMSQYDFRNVILGNKFEILYDYYVDLNTQAVKGVVGEDIESVDSIKTKWVKLDGLDIPLRYEGDNKVPTRGLLGIVFMGDYFGGEIETNLTLRDYNNSRDRKSVV